MLSRTPSPNKSPKRVALSSKDSNIIRSQQLLKSTTKLSPTKTTPSNPQSRRSSRSPTRTATTSSLFGKKPLPPLGFVIYSDPKDYSTELALSSTLKIQDENDSLQNKENLAPLEIDSRIQNGSSRKVLGDLDIDEFKGYAKFHNHHLNKTFQLDTFWNNDDFLTIPSYITPPRNANKVKYVIGDDQIQKSKTKKRSNSMSDVKEKVVKKLVFDILRD